MNHLVVLAFLGAAACSDDPVSCSASVGINLKAKPGDVSGTAISEVKGITTETSNPYGAFVGDATTEFGHPPPAASWSSR